MDLLWIAVAMCLAVALWLVRNPRCPQCGRRNWDRRITQPLWMCRGCAVRVDRQMRRYN